MMTAAASLKPAVAGADLSLPDNASLFTRLRLAVQALKVLEKDPANPICGPLLNACLDGGVYASLVQRLQGSEEGRRMLAEKPSLQGPELDLSALERLPDGTLGREFARYFRDNGISPFETTFALKNPIDFISKRYRETHDLLHVLTGYGTDVVGEMELQAYARGNLGIRTAVLILAFGTLGQLKAPRAGVGRVEYLRRLRAAHRRGRASAQFLPFWFEHHWATPVTELRERLCAPRERGA
ncbi:Coq4 family protein [Melittangium boletus]|uniref:Coq4 family protein n=1 Tax=Melittangium boletus TaxID=83453 RepID=UPI003DA2406F